MLQTNKGESMRVADALLALPKGYKRLVLMLSDTAVFFASMVGAMVLRLESFQVVMLVDLWIAAAIVIPLGLLILSYIGVYDVVVRFFGGKTFVLISAGILGVALFFILVSYYFQLAIPRSVPIIFSLLAFIGIAGARQLAGFLLGKMAQGALGVKVAIYGAGASGQQLVSMLRLGDEYNPVLFMDDASELAGRNIAGLYVYGSSGEGVSEVLLEAKVEQVLLAVPSASRSQRKKILDRLELLPFGVRSVPGLEQMIEGGVSLDQIQDVRIEDLLGRDSVPANPELLGRNIEGKTVLVTGGGGSIGSELCRQILALDARQLLVFEQSEFGLYKIEAELKAKYPHIEIIPLLGDVSSPVRVGRVFSSFDVDTVYHAAAYKHVPLVEHNPIQGLINNTFGTLVVAKAARQYGVKDFVLISTDKAVRPTNVMGATKRMSEVVLQALYADSSNTKFSMVRFGNVLGSSGSVVPRFREQIALGGPVTVTHPDINRFFMTIPEAVELVVQAGAMAEGGDVFVLDMGKPVKIVDLAMRMVHLSGLEVRGDDTPDGDIEIVYSGLRPGEKLYEELLIGDNVSGTAHPKIMRAEEEFMPWAQLEAWVSRMEEAVTSHDLVTFRSLMLDGVGGYRPHEVIEDWVWKKNTESSH